MKLVIIGLEAAGAAAATRARRNNPDAEIVVYDQAKVVSHIPCGIPYYLGGEISELEELIPRDSEWFQEMWKVDVHTNHHVTKVTPEEKQVEVYNNETGETFRDWYDKLILATGASPFLPPPFNLETHDNIFPVRNIEDAKEMQEYIEKEHVKKVAVIGSGSIGLEITEQLTKKGLEVTILEKETQLIPRMDQDIAYIIEQKVREKGVQVLLGEFIEELQGTDRVEGFKTNKGHAYETDMVIIATGVRPNTKIAKEAGIELGASGAITVNEKMETSSADIYAAGDVAESFSVITGEPVYMPLAATATKMGRIAGDAATNGPLTHKGILGTGIFRAFELTVGQTGFIERQLEEKGMESVLVYNVEPEKSTVIGGKDLMIKAIADKDSRRLLGVQIIGEAGVDKRLDVFATAISFGAKIDDLPHLDLAYSMPYSNPWDAVHHTGMTLVNTLDHQHTLTPQELIDRQTTHQPMQIIDVRDKEKYTQSHVKEAVNIPYRELREKADTLEKDLFTVVYCERGFLSNAARHLLTSLGFQDVRLLSGGNRLYQIANQCIKKQPQSDEER